MTVDPARLLQILEPAVRPGNASAIGGPQQGKPAFENRPFEDLLSEAKASKTDDAKPGELQPIKSNPLMALGGLGQVENATLREVLAQARGAQAGLANTD